MCGEFSERRDACNMINVFHEKTLKYFQILAQTANDSCLFVRIVAPFVLKRISSFVRFNGMPKKKLLTDSIYYK